MNEKGRPSQDDRGLSASQMVMILLAVVAVCAVFFTAGFLIGYNERESKGAPVSERVEPSSVIPPTVNTPQGETNSANGSATGVPVPPAPASVRQEMSRREAPVTPHEVRESMKPPTASAPATGGDFAVQVAASSSRPDAEKIVQTLKARGFPAFLVPPDKSNPNDQLYRVQVGPYQTREGAEAVRPRLEREGFSKPFIKH